MKTFPKKAFIIVVLLQITVLGFMIAKRVHLLDSGHRVLLKCEPIDPRSLFSGDYVILNYEISSLNKKMIQDKNNDEKKLKKNNTVYVALEKGKKDRFWHAKAISRELKNLQNIYPVVIRGTVKSIYNDIRIRYGVEAYFVPQGQGLKIEHNLGKTSVELAVSGSGESAIRKLFIDGQEVTFY